MAMRVAGDLVAVPFLRPQGGVLRPQVAVVLLTSWILHREEVLFLIRLRKL